MTDYKTTAQSWLSEEFDEQTIQEDTNLLMYYDISLGRV